MEPSVTMEDNHNNVLHALNSNWTLWAHLPHDTDWSLSSYKKVHTFNTIEHLKALNELIPDKMIKNCMLFIMRDDTKPIWEDPVNRNGGCFSYKIFNKNVTCIWNILCYAITGECLSSNKQFVSSITGLTISPKKNFCIIKIWMSVSDYQDPDIIVDIPNLIKHGCLFKTHQPEF